MKDSYKGSAMVVSGIISVIMVVVALNSYITVKAGHVKVATLFGDVKESEYKEGFHIVNPLLDFTSFDTRQVTNTWKAIQVPSQDKLKTSMDVSVTFRIDAAMAPEILQVTGTAQQVVAKHITPKVRSLLREVGKSVAQSQDFYRDDVQIDMQLYMEEGLREYLRPKGVIIEAVLFRDITLPQVVTSAVIQTKERQEQLEREKAQLNIVEQQAQQQVKQAEAREQAAIADANAKRTHADAEAYRILKEAEAQASANIEIANSVTQKLIDYNSVQQWSGNYPSTLMTGGSDKNVLLSLPVAMPGK